VQKLRQFEFYDMHKYLAKHRLHPSEHHGSDGYILFVSLISVFVFSTLAIIVALGFALMS
jgi:hypothetical protein